MKKWSLISLVLIAGNCWAALNVPLTIQEALYGGGSTGVVRTDEPFCMGVPVADAAGITTASTLGLSGSSAAQFRILGSWPSGNAKWVKVCGVVPSLSAGASGTVTLTDGASGNFGGPNLATDNGATITVATGAGIFTIKKANFNIIDSAIIGSTAVVGSSNSSARGLILTGPDPTQAFPGNVTCGTCTTVYSSANDPNSTATIEENGPVMAVIKAVGTHLDAAGHPYMHYTARIYFYKAKTWVKVTSVLRNADYDTSKTPSTDASGKTFNTAHKGLQSYELRIAPNLAGPLTYTIATEGAPQTGTVSGTDSAYVYQGQSKSMIAQLPAECDYLSPGCANKYATDTGYSVVKNGSTLTSGDATKTIQGWADISDSTGAGVEIGIYQMAAYWPKSLEFDNGGSDVRIGIWPRQNSQPMYQAWPAWSIHDLFLEFHAAAPASLSNEFLRFQHYLVARPPLSYVNAAGVFPYPIVDPVVEDNYYISTAKAATPTVNLNNFCWNGAAPCTPDRNVNNNQFLGNAMNVGVYREYGWPNGGPLNQEEFRWSDLQKFLQRGFTGRFLNSAHFYRFQAEKVWPHSDGNSMLDSSVNGFTWRSRPHWGTSGAELDGFGRPAIACGGDPCSTVTNSSLSLLSWSDHLHFHWYGMPDYYFLTGDETIRESMVPLKDWFTNPDTYPGGKSGGFVNTRALGIELMGASRYSEYLSAINDPDTAAVLAQALKNYNNGVKPETCLSGYPAGCPAPPAGNSGTPPDPVGISRARGVHTNAARAQGWCPAASGPNNYRAQQVFEESILIEGILSLRRAMGPSWSDYTLALDLAYGLSQWSMTEGFNDDGTSSWQGSSPFANGFRYEVVVDIPQVCKAGTAVTAGQTVQVGSSVYDNYTLPKSDQGMWFNFYLQYLMTGTTNWERQFRIAMDQVAFHQSVWPADFGSYQISALIAAITNPVIPTLQDVPFTVQDNGGGSYTLGWVVPNSVQNYRIKWSPKNIAPSNGLLNFENLTTNSFGLDPASNSTWFGSNNVTEPAPGTPGQTQTFTIATGVSGLVASNFSVKAYIARSANTGPLPASYLTMVSGTGQTGTSGLPLPSPFVVKATDTNGNPVSGINVTFTVTAGGGGLSPTVVSTDAFGLASTILTLGATTGANTVSAAAGTLAGSPVIFSATATSAASSPIASKITLVSGNGQSAPAGQQLSNPLVVLVTDSAASPVSGVVVTFTVSTGGGTLSASQTTTNSQGLASALLTLGANPGTNTVTVVSGTLAGGPITFTATGTASSAPGNASVQWTEQNTPNQVPHFVGWVSLLSDPVSHNVLMYLAPPDAHTIYSSDMYAYNPTANSFVHMLGTGTLSENCTPDLPNMPGERHPVGQMAIDTKRNVLWMYGGANQSCGVSTVNTNGTAVTIVPSTSVWTFPTSGQLIGQKIQIAGAGTFTIGSVQDAQHLTLTTSAGSHTGSIAYITSGSEASPRQDMYYLRLNADPTKDTWQQVTPAHIPAAALWSGLVYDPDNDVLFAFGSDSGSQTQDNWVYCPTWGSATPGTLSASQTAAGCKAPDDWQSVTPVGGIQPPGNALPAMTYDTSTRKIILFGGMSGGISYNQTWAYDVPTHSWAQKALATAAPPPYDIKTYPGGVPVSDLAYNSNTHKIIFHQTTNLGAPQDWAYDPVADTWTRLTSAGIGPVNTAADPYMTFDPYTNQLVTWGKTTSGVGDVWQASLQTSTVQYSRCDLNQDGVVNAVDVQIAINQALGISACSSADLIGNGSCSIVDIQRIINASAGGACKTGL